MGQGVFDEVKPYSEGLAPQRLTPCLVRLRALSPSSFLV